MPRTTKVAIVTGGSRGLGRNTVLNLAKGGVHSILRSALADVGAERFDYLVNNAGTSLHKAFDQTTEDDLDTLARRNTYGLPMRSVSASARYSCSIGSSAAAIGTLR